MQNVLRTIVKNLVDNPTEINIEETEENGFIVLKLSVAENDMGKIIGKQGKIARAIRTIVKSAANSKGKKVIIKID